MVEKTKFNLVKKWLKSSLSFYKHKNQRKDDWDLVVSGFTILASGINILISISFNLINRKDSFNTHKPEFNRVASALKKLLIGSCIIIASPVLVTRIALRQFFTLLSSSKTIFLNKGLRRVVNENKEIDKVLEELETKSKKYTCNAQEDHEVLCGILKDPQLSAYQKIEAVKNKIIDEEEKEAAKIEEASRINSISYLP